MSERNTLIRSLHDLGAAAWFGGSLMGATGLNGATSDASSPQDRLRLSTDGWARWTPWQVVAIGAHSVGAIGLVVTNRRRTFHQPGSGALAVAKTVLTLAAMGTSAYSGYLGLQLKRHQDEGAAGATEPRASASVELADAQRRLKLMQWATPVLTAGMIVLGAVEGEQQRGTAGLIDLGFRGTAKEVLTATGASLRRNVLKAQGHGPSQAGERVRQAGHDAASAIAERVPGLG